MSIAVRYLAVLATVLMGAGARAVESGDPPDVLPGSTKLDWTDDIASRMVDGIDRFLLREIDLSAERRARHWHRDQSSVAAYNASIEANRNRLAHILGVRDAQAIRRLDVGRDHFAPTPGSAGGRLQGLGGELAGGRPDPR